MSEGRPIPIEVPAARITYTVNLSPGRQLGFETMVDQTSGNEDIDEMLDRVTRSFNRQQAIVELPEMERQQKLGRILLKEKVKDRAALPVMYQAQREHLLVERDRQANKASEPRPNRQNPKFTPGSQAELAKLDHQIADLDKKHPADLDVADKDIEALKFQIDQREEAIQKAKRLIGASNPNLWLEAAE